MSKPASHSYEFGPYRLDPVRRLLFRDGKPVSLVPKVFDTLLALVQNHGDVLDKDFLMKEVWPNTSVEEAGLIRNISVLRKALGGRADEHGYIVTVPGRGYRFVADIRELEEPAIRAEETRVCPSSPTPSTADASTKSDSDSLLHSRSSIGRTLLGVRGFERRHLALSVLVVGLTGTLIYAWISSRRTASPGGKSVKTIAVLPLRPLGAGDGDEYMRLGMADALITRLAHLRQIVVRPTSAVRKYATADQDPLAAGRELDVDAVLEGSFQQSGDTFRVTLQLVRVQDGTHYWAGKFDEKFTDIFAVQDSISKQVAQGLELSLTSDEKNQLIKHDTENADAHRHYMLGRLYWNKRTEDGLMKGIDHFNKAIEKDPQYAMAYTGLADCYITLYGHGFVTPSEAAPKAREAAMNALERDETLAEAHACLAHIRSVYDWDWDAAEQQFKRAIQLKPNYPTAHHWYGYHLGCQGRFEESLLEMEKARQLEPTSLIINANVGWILCWAGEYDHAISRLEKTVDMDPDFPPARYKLAVAYEAKGMYREAIAEYQRYNTLLGNDELATALGRAYAKSGYKAAGKQFLEHWKRQPDQPYAAYGLAKAYVSLGEKEHALAWLERAYTRRAAWMDYLKVAPEFRSINNDPRFRDLLRRMGHKL